jgi:hypothetical protein
LIVITGSRAWDDREAIEAVMRGADGLLVGDVVDERSRHEQATKGPVPSLSTTARQVAREWDIVPFVVLEDRKRLGSSAKAVQSREIARAAENGRDHDGFEVQCHAFVLGDDDGAKDAIRALQSAGFKVTVHEQETLMTVQQRLF